MTPLNMRDLSDSVRAERVNAIAAFGFTERQARFLVHVLVHAGVFLERQYCAFAGIAHGQKTHDFLAKLVGGRYATVITPGALHRGRLFHVQYKPLYEAIGEPDNRHRKPASLGRMVERLMLLDAVLADRNHTWLGTENDKLAYFILGLLQTRLRKNEYPNLTFGEGDNHTVRYFPDKLPIGVERNGGGRHVFLYLVTRDVPVDFRMFLQRHAELFRVVYEWTIRLLIPRRFRKAANDATKLLKKRFGEIASRRFVGPQEERVMFEDLAKGIERDYKLRGLRSMRAAKGRMVHLKKAFGDVRALDITPDRVRDYQAHRRAEDASPATVNRETSHLARAFRIAVKSGLLTIVPPFPNRLEESAPRQGFFEHAEYLAVRQHLAPAVYQDVLDFAYYSGWRRGEITGLTWREIDMAGGVIKLDPERSKTRTGRVLPLSQPLKEVLQRRVAARRLDSLMVFHRDGEEIIDWRKAWAAACKLAGLPGKRLHDCRRTAARNLIRSGTPERVAMQLTGHKTRSVFDRYNIVSESDLRAGVDRLAAYVKKLPKEMIVEPLKKAGKGRG